MKTIAIYANSPLGEQQDTVIDIIKHLSENNFLIKINTSVLSNIEILNHIPNLDFCQFETKEQIIDATLLLSVGGDGTFLRAATLVQNTDIPILGVNVGRLGFLADLSPNDIPNLANIICLKQYDIEQRSMLEITTNNENYEFCHNALNDIAIFKRETLGILSIQTSINGNFLNTFWSDGILIATPTGSTAYSLSLGGPIITPDNSCLIISPMAPHTLTVRPIITPDTSTIILKVESRDKNFNISIDSNSYQLPSGIEIKIKKSNQTIKIAKPLNHNYFNTLRNKLMWGIDSRNS